MKSDIWFVCQAKLLPCLSVKVQGFVTAEGTYVYVLVSLFVISFWLVHSFLGIWWLSPPHWAHLGILEWGGGEVGQEWAQAWQGGDLLLPSASHCCVCIWLGLLFPSPPPTMLAFSPTQAHSPPPPCFGARPTPLPCVTCREQDGGGVGG